jgi:tRNA pseudouridine38-40 synthase
LVDVSTGRFTPEDIGKILETKDRTKSGRTAPPQGLYLNQVFY